ncbi:MAG: hypothetical protein CMM78_04855 [Rhodospirillaceae bacterium]|nr:hypothetical protein [Rhodospirillaceae bacterium]|tara:strand:+ start:338 stop:1174 length:837 start_codon:yes stop_codon:yes gene_type:complete
MVFAVSEDGFYSEYIYCPETKCIPSNQAMYRAIRACEERARGKKCKVFAINDKIVWKGFEGQIKTTLTDDTSKISRVMNPIQLTGKQETGLKDYNKSLLENPDWRGGFAVARDGSYGWVTYPKETESAEVVSVIDAIGSCESYTSLSCSLFAQDRLLVYNDLSIDSYFYQKEAASTSASQPSSTEREIEVEWAKFPGKIHGTVNLNSGKVFIRSDNGIECAGTDLKQTSQTTGFWTIKCDDGTVAQGSYRALGPGKGSVGLGIDGEGNEIRYVIAPIN